MISRNKNIRREFELLDTFEAGIVLTGPEVKSIRTNGIKFEGSYVKLIGNEVHLINAHISPYEYAQNEDYDPQRTRKLLLNKKEILKIRTKLSQGPRLTIVPVKCYNKKGRIKLEIAIARGKKTWEKKQVEKRRTEKRRVKKELKEYLKK